MHQSFGRLPMPIAERLATDSYADHVNPHWVKLLNLLEMNLSYGRCDGTELFTTDGLRILDFLSGYCVHNAGHNHPAIVAALKDELDKSGPVMLQSNVPELAGELAERLCKLAGGRLSKVFFASSGSEGVETAIKFARAYTGRVGLLSCDRAFHGLTCGALSLMNGEYWRKGFGPLLPETVKVPFAALAALERPAEGRQSALFSLLGHKGDIMFVHFRRSFQELHQAQLDLARLAIGDYLGARVASLYESVSLPTLFGIVAAVAFVACVALVILIKPTVRLMSGVK